MNIEEYLQDQLKKEQRRRSILGQIHKLSKEEGNEEEVKKLKERMDQNGR